MFDKLHRHSKHDSSDFSNNDPWPAPAPAYAASSVHGPASSSYGPQSSSYAPAPSSYGPQSSSYAPAPSSYGPQSSSYAPAPSSYAPVPSSYAPASSSYAPPHPPFQTRFASLSLHQEDRLRFLRFPQQVIDQSRAVVHRVWPLGIQEERPYGNSHEFKLEGYPWRGLGKESSNARRLISALLATLHSSGWVLTLNSDVSKSARDKDTLLFRYQMPAPAPCDWCSVAFSKMDRLRFIDAPFQLYQSLPAKLGQQWIKSQEEYEPGVWEIKMHGYPWAASGTETMRVRELLIVLVETLEEEGWSVYASIDQKNGEQETDTWHLCRPRGWVRGAPVYHH